MFMVAYFHSFKLQMRGFHDLLRKKTILFMSGWSSTSIASKMQYMFLNLRSLEGWMSGPRSEPQASELKAKWQPVDYQNLDC